MDHEGAGVVGEPGGHLHLLAGLEAPGVLQPPLPGRWRLAVAPQGAPLLGVDVDVVGHVAGVAEAPALHGAQARPVVDSLRVEGPTVDGPEGAVTVVPVEAEGPGLRDPGRDGGDELR